MSAKIKRTDKKDEKKDIDEMFHTLKLMVEGRHKKTSHARESLVSNLKVASEKYLTANGVMQAIDIMMQIKGGAALDAKEMQDCMDIAQELSAIAAKLADDANDMPFGDMNTLFDDVYQHDFASKRDMAYRDLVKELMVLQLCCNIGPSASDIDEAFNRMTEEIKKQTKAMDEEDPDWVGYDEFYAFLESPLWRLARFAKTDDE